MAHPGYTKGPMLNANDRSAYAEYRIAVYVYIYIYIHQYFNAIYLIFGGTPLSIMVIRGIDFFFASAHL
jgi:hypothetical protein